MTWETIIALVLAVAGWGMFGRCYMELWRWARQCQHARIAVAYKQKVQLQAPLVEWLMWCNQLSGDGKSHGRVVWRNGYASVAITKAVMPPGKLRGLLKRVHGQRGTSSPPPSSKTGKWTAKDQTVKT